MELILSGDNINEGRIKINSLSGASSYWSAGTGTYSMIGNDLTGNIASNDYSFVGGFESVSSGNTSFAFGNDVIAGGDFSTSFGTDNKSIGKHSYTSGEGTTSIGNNSFASNNLSKALGEYSIALNNFSQSSGSGSTSLNIISKASGDFSFASGQQTTAIGDNSFISSSNSNVSGDRSVILGGQSMSLSDNDVVYVSKLNINNIDDDNTLKNVLTLESNDDVNQKEYDTNFIEISGDSLFFAGLLEVNKYYSFNRLTGGQIFYLPTTGNTGDFITLSTVNDGTDFEAFFEVTSTYNKPILIGLGDSTGIEIDNTTYSGLKILKGTQVEFTYFGSDVGEDCWVVTNFNTFTKYYNSYDNGSVDDYDALYLY
jgi:hypothetical protein